MKRMPKSKRMDFHTSIYGNRHTSIYGNRQANYNLEHKKNTFNVSTSFTVDVIKGCTPCY